MQNVLLEYEDDKAESGGRVRSLDTGMSVHNAGGEVVSIRVSVCVCMYNWRHISMYFREEVRKREGLVRKVATETYGL